MKLIVAKIVILVIAGIVVYCVGRSSTANKKAEFFEQQLGEQKKELEGRYEAQLKSKEKVIKDKDEVIRKLKSEVVGLKEQVDKYEGLYRTRTVVCTALGAAVVGALFVGTFLGAKGRRDALRACNNHPQTHEEGT